ncbi:hypothetical protein JN00_0323 [Metamycoplasma subdolum]|uniref:Capsule synthesis protein CapA domain-containing protein n=1 Tax=Metamycoplasma subdolum TaxID=92407 RepID=A0A3M0A0G0_9BACT|nr:TIGR00282 family metallophosphoesterase [Metamycoplasma subdolum]RMA78493.1 hypothetical protein JN00_0323 [Metamycoplasma subdolum]WPB50425.1 TIGR00282 family metallophosphoesterase [Metamycoplasma subdolum]
MESNNINVLFLGDIFGDPGIQVVKKYLPKLKKDHKIDFVIAQAENVSGRKGFVPSDYKKLKEIGIDAFTLGNHVWAKGEISSIIANEDLIRPANINENYPGSGIRFFKIKNKKIAIVSMLGINFNPLLAPWHESSANNFFDEFDKLYGSNYADYWIIDFHGETTSEKAVFGLYIDGKVDALFGTHTHVQTNDARVLPNGTYFITDAGMCGPTNCAIGADYNSVYQQMRYHLNSRFKVSTNKCQVNGVVFTLTKDFNEKRITPINFIEEE